MIGRLCLPMLLTKFRLLALSQRLGKINGLHLEEYISEVFEKDISEL